MKNTIKGIAMVLVLVLCFTYMGAVVTYGAEAPKKPTTASEYVAYLKENYSVLVKEDRSLYQDQTGMSTEAWAEQLPSILAACEYLGSGFTKALAKKDASGYLEIAYASAKVQGIAGAVAFFANPRDGKAGTFKITGGTMNAVVPVRIILHEVAHCFDQKTTNVTGSVSKTFQALGYKSITGSTVRGDYISEYAKVAPSENYAESFAYGIINGATNPCPYGKDNQVYKCCKAVFDDLVSFAGYGSRATQRMAGYLGIDISDKLKSK
jgi:hypothetical protein